MPSGIFALRALNPLFEEKCLDILPIIPIRHAGP